MHLRIQCRYQQVRRERARVCAHPEAISILVGCFDVNDHSVQTAAAVQLAMLASSLDHKRDMLA